MQVFVGDGLELQLASPQRGGFAHHSHDEFVLSANVCGTEWVRLDRDNLVVGTDEVTVYNPGQVQSCRTEVAGDDRWACVSLHVTEEGWERRSRAAVEFRSPVVVDRSLRDELVCIGLTPPDRGTASRVDAWLDRLLKSADIGRNGEPTGADVPIDPLGPVEEASPIRIADIARELGWSRETFTRRFVEATGTPPYAWHLQSRLRTARRLLRSGRNPATVAAELGFADQSHLHRHYVAAYAETPAVTAGRGVPTVF